MPALAVASALPSAARGWGVAPRRALSRLGRPAVSKLKPCVRAPSAALSGDEPSKQGGWQGRRSRLALYPERERIVAMFCRRAASSAAAVVTVAVLLALRMERAACLAGGGFLLSVLFAKTPPSPEIVLLGVWVVQILAT